MISVSVKNASVRYKNHVLFENLDLTLPAGEWTCLLGQSGIGKSSLLRLLAGLLASDGYGDIQCSDSQNLESRVAYMAQTDLLMPWLSVLQNVTIGAKLRGNLDQHDIEKAKILLDKVGLAQDSNRYPSALSGGMRQRVALARTMFEDKPAILMDEPFSALDAITRHRLQALAVELLIDKTVLLITHDPMEALRLGHHIRILGGDPVQLGPAIIPQGKPPRPVDDPHVVELQQEVWQQLAA